ncbi:potassium channel family protein [Phytomonospora endophytica]|uniref:Trk system potassium uptake protein TrkA n=1 Tax=Phytomonospora endophytica TaxID=714109 RepID=A0A841FIW0_9ACTN|nr:TrkA family potassium uptake protein [Phytomonospora endophytica]MBB6034883.1 trk system potassium uptake protein TrkA [Phytomonospora endophytica]GIG70587.1 potassium transporter TrkA [Phytomonospora endophytica]
MHVVIMGCGRVGSTLARGLTERGHSVAVIDQNPEAFRRLDRDFEGQMITGVGFDRTVLTEAGISRADAFAAVSSGDNSNIIAARVARETFGVTNVVARIYDSGRAAVYERLGIPTVATVRWAAGRLMRLLDPGPDSEVWRDSTSAVAMIELNLHQDWTGQPLERLEKATGVRTAYLIRFGLGVLPTPSTVIQDGDQVFALVTDDLATPVRRTAAEAPEGAQ